MLAVIYSTPRHLTAYLNMERQVARTLMNKTSFECLTLHNVCLIMCYRRISAYALRVRSPLLYSRVIVRTILSFGAQTTYQNRENARQGDARSVK